MNSKQEKLDSFARLLDIMDDLRANCPWDKKQTFESLRHLTIEETYELADAILEGNASEIKKELGDLLLHIIFYSKLGSEAGTFDIGDVANCISEKLVFRHPHIYGNMIVEDENEVKKNWENLKLKEGNNSVLDGVPKGLPSLIKSMRIQEKSAGVGFDWDSKDQVWSKVEEEIIEFKKNTQEEFGDILFSLINYASFLKINSDTALERANKKFIRRFNFIETRAKKLNKSVSDLSLQEMENFWEESKYQSSLSDNS
jgi:XTP/dITP diphosphohydrolase